ncbi:MAG: methyltransferase domain-containing protein [Chloroflexi bacterium]|nr:MAG: methyltransferase domain-containing protein [Chloroflexota bacterium]
MNRLTNVAELLDGSLDDEAALVANLRDLSRLNSWTGGAALSVAAVRTFGPIDSLLDVGTGAADIPVALVEDAQRHGRQIRVTATDSRPEVLAAARRASPTVAATDGLVLTVADGRSLPYPDASFDIVHASLVVHHLDPVDAVACLRELRRVARRGVVVNDLTRSRLGWIGAWLLTHSVAHGRYTRHDGPLSVRRAYTAAELVDLLLQAGLTPTAVRFGFARHRVAIASETTT